LFVKIVESFMDHLEPEYFSPEDLADIEEGLEDIRQGKYLTLEEYRQGKRLKTGSAYLLCNKEAQSI
jgi:hypothetical protein